MQIQWIGDVMPKPQGRQQQGGKKEAHGRFSPAKMAEQVSNEDQQEQQRHHGLGPLKEIRTVGANSCQG